MTDSTTAQHGTQVLVTVHAPNRPSRSYLFDATGRHSGMDPDYFLDRQVRHTPTTWFVHKEPGLLSRIATAIFAVCALGLITVGATHAATVRVVLTGSMVPAINPGDAVIAVDDRFRAPHLGDVVVYTGKRFDGTSVAPFAHRIVGGDASTGWIVRGDANKAADVQRPTAADITGVVVATVPNVGHVLSPELILMLAIAVFGLWFVLDGAVPRA